MANILEKCDSPTWLVTNEKIQKVLEYLLWDSFKCGISQNLAGCAPCIFLDTDRLLALLRKALGKTGIRWGENEIYESNYRFIGGLGYRNLHKINKVFENDVTISFFNDNHEQKPVFKREHLIHAEVTGIFGSSEGMFTTEQRNWNGRADICIKSKAKKRMSFAGRENRETTFAKTVINPRTRTFNGSDKLPILRPSADTKLYPIDRTNRVIIG